MISLIETCKRIQSFDSESEKAFLSTIINKTLPKGTSLLYFNEIDKEMHFIVRGAGRVYYEKNGRDISAYFALDGHFLGGIESLFTQKPSDKAIELLEDSEVESINYAAFESLFDKYPMLERLGRKLAIFAFLEGQRKIESIRFLSAADRYQELEVKYPGISNRVPLKHLASYLGISQVSLSRIRAGKQ